MVKALENVDEKNRPIEEIRKVSQRLISSLVFPGSCSAPRYVSELTWPPEVMDT
jgi:hypothetical protein